MEHKKLLRNVVFNDHHDEEWEPAGASEPVDSRVASRDLDHGQGEEQRLRYAMKEGVQERFVDGAVSHRACIRAPPRWAWWE